MQWSSGWQYGTWFSPFQRGVPLVWTASVLYACMNKKQVMLVSMKMYMYNMTVCIVCVYTYIDVQCSNGKTLPSFSEKGVRLDALSLSLVGSLPMFLME